MKAFLLTLIFLLCSCETHVKPTPNHSSVLNFYGKATLAIDKNADFWLSDGPTLITKGKDTITYGIITQDYLNFIGTKNPPDVFLSLSFSGLGEAAEKTFFETLKAYNITHKKNRDTVFYELTSSEDKYIYIASPHLNFIIEIYSKTPTAFSLSEIIKTFNVVTPGEH